VISRSDIRRDLNILPRVLWIVWLVCFLSACVAQTIVDDAAVKHGFERTVQRSDTFRHLIYSHRVSNTPQKVLHIYLEGDGNPWLRPNIISVDPTGRTPFTLDLMALDSQPSIYIGRPCYHGFYQDDGCGPALWTHARYSTQVVDSMATVLNKIIQRYKTKQLYLVGYSGGGVLAMLLAERLKQVKKVMTIAANLDVAAWAEQHQYSPLRFSLNPAERLHLYKDLPQHHFAGRQDNNVSLDITTSFVNKQNQAQIKLSIFDQFDHKCCWLDIWPEIVKDMETR